jgi:hypothetical protein
MANTFTRRGRPPHVSIEDGVARTTVRGQRVEFKVTDKGTLRTTKTNRGIAPEDLDYAKANISRSLGAE